MGREAIGRECQNLPAHQLCLPHRPIAWVALLSALGHLLTVDQIGGQS